MNIRALVSTAVILIAFGCAHPVPSDGIQRGSLDKNWRTYAFIDFGWDFELGTSVAEIKRSLGEPLVQRVQHVRNFHVDGQIDDVYILEYPGLEVTVYRVNYDDSPYEFLIELTITSGQYPLKRNLKIGSSRAEVISALGHPDGQEGLGSIIWYSDETGAAPKRVTFYLTRNRVTRVEWSWFPD